MNEEQKNIETCLPESILAEVASVPQDPQFVSLVNESLDPLKQQAFQQAGSDAYNEVVKSHQPYTFTSSVRQMKSNLILLLRRFWRFPFGAGTIRSLSDMWQHYITRLQGSETYGIPSRLDQLTDLPSAPLLVADRKISGVPNAPDGISLVNLLCSSAKSEITQLTDPNKGWTAASAIPNLRNLFPNLTKFVMGCGVGNGTIISNASVQNMEFPELEELVDTGNNANAFIREIIYGYTPPTKTISVPKLRKIEKQLLYYTSHASAQTVEELEFPALEEVTGSTGCAYCAYSGDSKLKRALFPVIETCHSSFYTAGVSGNGMLAGTFSALEYLYIGYKDNTGSNIGLDGVSVPALEVIELKDGFGKSLNLNSWSPTLDSSNLQQFLSNFKTYIADRLKGFPIGQGPTLTLSQAVFSEIWDSQGQPQVKGDGLDQLRADIHRIIRTVKQWAVNKA